MSTENIHIAGRYNKFLRNLSQSPWIDKDDVRVKDSVQELIEDGLKVYLKFEKSIFTSSGREDVDVRMLGRGRPFVFKMTNPQFLADYNAENLRKVESFVNQKHSGKIHIRDLQIVTKSDVSKYMTETEDSKRKEYRALCCCSRTLTQCDINSINSTKDLVIEQMTPIRVLHRRTWATRKRTIYTMRFESVETRDFDSVREEHLDKIFALFLTTEAGTYIKEFVHGDFGRTEPNLSSLLGGDCEADLMELDVMKVHSDWPPEIASDSPIVSSNSQKTGAQHSVSSDLPFNDLKMDNSIEALADLYKKALQLMQDCEKKPRGDDRQELYLQSRRLFERSLNVVESLNLFSDNETIDDVATKDLKYLLIPAHLATIILSAECSPNRLETFTKAEFYIKKFMKNISDYGLGDGNVERALNKSDQDAEETLINSQSSSVSLEAAMRLRTEKIERFKRARQLDDKLSEMERRLEALGPDQSDEEAMREYYLIKIKKSVEDMLDTLEREVRPAIFLERSRSGDSPENLKSDSCPSPMKKKIGQPITIVKDHHQKQVYGVGYPSRPTVTVDEFISKKIRDGDLAFDKHKEIYANSLQRYAEQPNLRREQEEKSDEEREKKEDQNDEEELRRKRKWDEFKDDNPRGSGNRYNMG